MQNERVAASLDLLQLFAPNKRVLVFNLVTLVEGKTVGGHLMKLKKQKNATEISKTPPR